MAYTNGFEDTQQGGHKSAVLVVEPRILVRTCVLRLLKSEFADLDIIEMESINDLSIAVGRGVRLIALSVANRKLTDLDLESDLTFARESFPDASIVLLSSSDDDSTVSEALQRGISGIFSTSVPVEVAIAGLRLVLAGGIYCPRPMSVRRIELTNSHAMASETLIRTPMHESVRSHPAISNRSSFVTGETAPLTPREENVLSKLELGHPNKTIAAMLNLSENTVKMHIRNIMRKLGARNRTEAVFLWSKRPAHQACPPPPN